MPRSGGRLNTRRFSVTRTSLTSADTERFLDLCDDAVVGVEELVVHRAPAAELVDREEPRRSRELLLVDQRGVDRAVALRLEDLLALLRAQERDELAGLRGTLAAGGHGDRVLDQDRLVRYDVVEVLAGLLGCDRLVLVSQEHVALAARERRHRVTRRLVLDHDVVE